MAADMCHVDVTGVHLISIPAPPRGATQAAIDATNELIFQFTPLREGRLAQAELSRANQQFQFPPLREGRPSSQPWHCTFVHISIPAPPRGATFSTSASVVASKFQFPPLREGRPLVPLLADSFLVISIPAPPRGATGYPQSRSSAHLFQFPPLREGRLKLIPFVSLAKLFQFPPLREGRQQKICNFCKSFVQPSQITAL